MATPKAKAKSSPASKAAPAKKDAAKASPKTAAKPSAKAEAAKGAADGTAVEVKVASEVLKLIDQAASALRKTVETGASMTAKTRLDAQKKAHTLLSKAHGFLSSSLEEGKKAIDKIAP